ncbi:hypothetical protein R1sor_002481 [Riccia sorocarpa]|uniref:Peroxisomal membrane protein 11B n=1 Tax=Riccia sorocarpa TaxID=122646 RepID=A0ABD3H2W2_9MARC
MARKNDSLDRFVVFLAKRDGIDKLVKTFQYTSKMAHWYLLQKGNPELAARFKSWEVSSGLSRKCFRSGRFLTGFNAVRTTKYPNWRWQTLAVVGNSGEFVYFFFDHLTWFSRINLLDSKLADKFCYISAFGEAVSYICFTIQELTMLTRERNAEKQHLKDIEALVSGSKLDRETTSKKISEKRAAISVIRFQRAMRICAISSFAADFIIDLVELSPNPFVTHAITLGISGLTSAWTGCLGAFDKNPEGLGAIFRVYGLQSK